MVANTGTLTKMDGNVGRVDFEAVRHLRAVTGKYGTILKEHNADYLEVKREKIGHLPEDDHDLQEVADVLRIRAWQSR